MRSSRGVALIAVALQILSISALTTVCFAQTDSFDKPVRVRVVDLGPAPEYTDRHIKLSCYYYQKLMVKQLDMGNLGAEWLAIFPVRAGQAPACRRSHGTGERTVEGKEWSGYFKGVKQRFVLFDAEDGFNSGIAFAVYDSRTGKRIFEDSALRGLLKFSTAPDGQLTIKYTRVVQQDCSLPNGKADCWDQIRKKLGFENASMPDCTDYGEDLTDPSVIGYPVGVLLSPHPLVTIGTGPIECWAAE